ncbi:MAG: SOS response-associated peptidase [Geminicoccaceae bacterium]
MCGRFALSLLPGQFALLFGCDPPEGLTASWNVTPDRQIPIVRMAEEGREAAFARWGLLGPWMKEANDPGRQINARSESAAGKPMFRDSFKKGRCLIPATAFYEWQKAASGPARPYCVALASGEPFAFAGLWRRNRLTDGALLESCVILTIDASPLLRPIHPRMPVILPPASHALWLDPEVKDPEFLQALLTPVQDMELAVWEIGRAVNSPKNDGPQLLEPVEPPRAAQPSLL